MTIRITHAAGIGEWKYGETVTLSDRLARKLTEPGYAVEVKPKAKKDKE